VCRLGHQCAEDRRLSAAFPEIWLHAWGLSWLVAFPVLLCVLPLVRRIVMALVQN